MLDLTVDALKPGNSLLRGQWVNGNDYERANESFGIIQFKPDFIKPLGMFEYSDKYAREQQIRYRWVAEQQGTLVAVLPVHTREERDLFRLLVQSSPLFANVTTRQPNWTSLAAIWASHANGKSIFYKVREHRASLFLTGTALISVSCTGSSLSTSKRTTRPGTTTAMRQTRSRRMPRPPSTSAPFYARVHPPSHLWPQRHSRGLCKTHSPCQSTRTWSWSPKNSGGRSGTCLTTTHSSSRLYSTSMSKPHVAQPQLASP
jgi:hypothetical protein